MSLGAADAALANGLYNVPIFVGSAITIISCAIIIGSYAKFEELRRHPNGLVLLRCLFDAILAITVTIESALRVTGNVDSTDCRGFSFWVQLSTLGSELCFLCLSSDLFFAMRNPFMNYKTSMLKYRLFSIVVAAAVGGILIGSGPGVYGVTAFGICWVRPTAGFANGYMWAFFYAPLFAIYIWSFFVLVYARRRLTRGLRDTYEARSSSFMRGVGFVLGYTCFWAVTATVYWISLAKDTGPDISPAAAVFAALFTSKGLATLSVWLHNHDLRAVAKADAALKASHGGKWRGKVNRQLQPHLNLALRKEILHYTTLAIRLSVVQAAGEDRIGAVIGSLRAQLRASRRGRSATPGQASGSRGGDSTDRSAKAAGGQQGRAGSAPPGDGTRRNSAFVAIDSKSPSKPISPTNADAATPTSSTSPPIAIDSDGITARASAYAPHNDRKQGTPDHQLEVAWKSLDIGLHAPLFERGGIYDLASELPAAGGGGGGGGGDKGRAGPAAAMFAAMKAKGAGKGGAAQVDGSSRSKLPSSSSSSSSSNQHGDDGHSDGGAIGPSSHLTPTSADIAGVLKRPPVELYDLAPDVFARIRDLCGITPAQYLLSLARTTRERFSEGASGAFMCFSWDMRFVIKSMEGDEAEVLKRMLPAYLAHLRANRDTTIVRFFGCMSLRLYNHTLYFVVMENMFPTSGPNSIVHERFDLKGSWVGRSASKGVPGTLAYCRFCNESFKVGDKYAPSCRARPNRPCLANTVLKDNDINFKLRLLPERAAQLAAQLRADLAFLRRMKVMDYSLLIGVHNRKFKIETDGSLGASTASGQPTPAAAGGGAAAAGAVVLTKQASGRSLVPAPLLLQASGRQRSDNSINAQSLSLQPSGIAPRTLARIVARELPPTAPGGDGGTPIMMATGIAGALYGGAQAGYSAREVTPMDGSPSPSSSSPRDAHNNSTYQPGGGSSRPHSWNLSIAGSSTGGGSWTSRSRGVSFAPLPGPMLMGGSAAAAAGYLQQHHHMASLREVSVVSDGDIHSLQQGGGSSSRQSSMRFEQYLQQQQQQQQVADTHDGGGGATPFSALPAAVYPPPVPSSSLAAAAQRAYASSSAPHSRPSVLPHHLNNNSSASGSNGYNRSSSFSTGVAAGGSGTSRFDDGNLVPQQPQHHHQQWSSDVERDRQDSTIELEEVHVKALVNAIGASQGTAYPALNTNPAYQHAHQHRHPVPFFRADDGGMSSAIIEGPGTYYMGIIDILQEYDTIKRVERWLKTTFLLQDKKGVSVMPPDDYADRFEQRVIQAVIESNR